MLRCSRFSKTYIIKITVIFNCGSYIFYIIISATYPVIIYMQYCIISIQFSMQFSIFAYVSIHYHSVYPCAYAHIFSYYHFLMQYSHNVHFHASSHSPCIDIHLPSFSLFSYNCTCTSIHTHALTLFAYSIS